MFDDSAVEEQQHQTPSLPAALRTEEGQDRDAFWVQFQSNVGVYEMYWGIFIVVVIFLLNGGVLCVILNTKELRKARHLWTACFAASNLVVGSSKALELVLVLWPQYQMCVVQRTTFAIPYVINMMVLTCLALDRFVAVVYPYYYVASVSNKHVVYGFTCVLLTATVLSSVSVTLGFIAGGDCRPQELQLTYLTVILTFCAILIVFLNTIVLQIARKHLNAIYKTRRKQQQSQQRRVSLACINCGHRNIQTLEPANRQSLASSNTTQSTCPDLDTVREQPDEVQETQRSANSNLEPPRATCSCTSPSTISAVPAESSTSGPGRVSIFVNLPNREAVFYNLITEPDQQLVAATASSNGQLEITMVSTAVATASETMEQCQEAFVPRSTLSRTRSLPAIPDNLALIIPSDPSMPISAVRNLNESTLDMMENTTQIQIDVPGVSDPETGAPGTSQAITVGLPRSRSFTSVYTKKIWRATSTLKRYNILSRFRLGYMNVFQVAGLLPSIRFARSIIFVKIPLWILIFPVIIIIPLHQECLNSNSKLDCRFINALWAYLMIHLRSVLPLQAVIDIIGYVLASREFHRALKSTKPWSKLLCLLGLQNENEGGRRRIASLHHIIEF